MKTPLEVLRLYRAHDYSLRDAVASRAETDPGRPFIWYDGGESRWSDVQMAAAGMAAALAGRGVRHGDRVAIMARNTPDHVVLLLALGRIGAIMVPINPDFGAEETRYVLDHAGVGGVLVAKETVDTVRAASAELAAAPWLIGLEDGMELATTAELVGEGGSQSPPDEGGADDPVIIIFTSGSTGFPKAVLHSQRNFITAGEAFVARIGLQDSDRLMIVLPMYHINAMFYQVAGTLAAGASLAIAPRFSASRFWDTAVAARATEANIIEAIGAILIERPRSEFRPEHTIRAVYGVRPRFIEAFNTEFHIPVCVGGYGMSEIPGVISTPLDRPNAPGSMGVLSVHPDPERPWVQCRIVDEKGNALGDNETGELQVKTPIIMKGYFRDPEQTRAAFVDGWFKTGDLIRRDGNGFYTFVSRKHDIIRRRGENISAAEIDRIVLEHPAVNEVATVAVPAALGEDEILAVVVAHKDVTVTAEAIADWCAERLAAMKVPRYVAFVDRLPYTPTMKIDRNALRQDAALFDRAVDLGERKRRPAT